MESKTLKELHINKVVNNDIFSIMQSCNVIDEDQTYIVGEDGHVMYSAKEVDERIGDVAASVPEAQVQADWSQLDRTAVDYINSKPFGYTTEGFGLEDGSTVLCLNIESGTSGEYKCIYKCLDGHNFLGSCFVYSYMASDDNDNYYLMYSMYGYKKAIKDIIGIGGENWGYGSAITNTDEDVKPYTWAVFFVEDISTLNEEYKEHFTNNGVYFINYDEETQVEWVSLVLKHHINDTFIPDTIARTDYVDSALASLVNSAPETLDTLNELSAALGNDENFAATVTASIGEKISRAGDTMTGSLVLAADPTESLEAATKQYVDTVLATAIPAPTSAAVGQIIRVSAVDSNGTPTAWETVNFEEAVNALIDAKIAAIPNAEEASF